MVVLHVLLSWKSSALPVFVVVVVVVVVNVYPPLAAAMKAAALLIVVIIVVIVVVAIVVACPPLVSFFCGVITTETICSPPYLPGFGFDRSKVLLYSNIFKRAYMSVVVVVVVTHYRRDTSDPTSYGN